MDDEIVVNDVPNDGDTPPVENNPKASVSAYEDTAREMGWRPKDEWEGDPDKWRDAREFVDRGELFSKIDTMGKELKETRKALKMLQEHHSKVKETEYKRAVEELKGLQKQHLESGNADEYIKTTDLLTDLKAEQKAREVFEESVPQQPVGLDPRFVSWTKENSWYERNPEMHEYADTIGEGYAKRHPGIDPTEVLRYVTKEVKLRYKDHFENPNRNKPSAVEGSGNKPTGKSKDSFELTDDEKKVMNTFLRQGLVTKETYIEQVKASRGFK